MTTIAQSVLQPMPRTPASDLPDQLFWMSKVDDELPKAVIVPDRKRSTAVERVYDAVGFELSAEVVRLLKSMHPERGVSDLAVCAGLLAMLLAKVQRDDRVVVGMRSDAINADAGLLVPLNLSCGRDATFQSITADIAQQVADMASHSMAAVHELPQILGLEVGSHRHPLYDIALATGESGAAVDLSACPVDLAFLFETGAGHIRGRVSYACELYERATVERLVGYLVAVAEQVTQQRGIAARDLAILTDQDRHRVVIEFNRGRASYPLTQSLHGLFEAQAQRTPQAAAAIHRHEQLSYAELNKRANKLAHTLLALGLKKGEFVGILLRRSCDFVVAMLGVFKAGGAYVPLDPTYPRDRIAYMLDDSEAALLITDADVAGGYGDMFGSCQHLKVLVSTCGQFDGASWAGRPALRCVSPEQLAKASERNPELGLKGTDRAYMIYTSGSTGRPKGAICRHDGALNHLFGELEGIGVDTAFNFLQTAATSSDISVWQFVAPLMFGGATVIADYDTVVDPALLATLIRDQCITVAEPVPVVLRALLDHLAALPQQARAFPDLQCMMCTGEALPGELVDRWLAMFPQIPIANTYGPTETSDDVTLMVLREPIADRFAVTPIGRPLPNVRIFVVDRDMRPVPLGIPGEICIGGIAVGEGYWKQPDKTLAAFVACPFDDVAPGPMYRTGDLGRWLPDGVVEFLGRIDQQVKVRGFRVEPGEIEQAMIRHPGIQDAAVVAVLDQAGNRRLVGHYVAHPGALLTPPDLRQFLKAQLADHMVPAALVPLGALPLTPLGKVDRRALSLMDVPSHSSPDTYVEPRGDLERVLAEVWADTVGTDRVGVHDNFFEIGGDSILTIHVVAALRRRGIELAPRQIFRHPTVAELAAALAAAAPAATADDRASRVAAKAQSWDVGRWREALTPLFPDLQDVYPLSATQRGIYFQSLLVPKSSGAYVEQIGFAVSGELDSARFERAWQSVVQRVEVLRTAVVRRGAPHPLQVVVREANMVPISLDLRDVPSDRQKARLETLLLDDRAKGFDLKRPPLARVTLVRLAERKWYVLWSYHHLILDGWAEPLVLEAVFQTYDAIGSGGELGAIASPRYRDFVAWSEAEDLPAAELYWRSQLDGFDSRVSIHDTSPGVAPPSSSEISHGWEHAQVDGTAMSHAARRTGLTLSTILHGAWALLLLRRASGVDDIVFGSIASGRQCALPGIESVCGLVAVTQPLRARVPQGATVSAWLRMMQLKLAEMREHEHTPLAQILQWSEVPAARRPLFDSIVVVGNYAGSDLAGCQSASRAISDVRYVTQPLFAFTLFATVDPDLSLTLVYDRKRCAPDTARRLLADYVQLLAAIAENPEQRIAGLVDARPGLTTG